MEIQLDIGENFYDPQAFVEALVCAEDQGFKTAWFGDHFMPWFHSGKQSQFVWSTLGAAMERTTKIKSGPLVTTPMGARYHPAVIAQASATIDNLFPGRLLLGVGTGEAVNERPFWNGEWPSWDERSERLIEGVQLIRKLWQAKKPFSFSGKHFRSDFYFLYTKPKTAIPIYFAAEGRRAAFFAGKFGDKIVTLSPRNNLERLQDVILPSYHSGMIKGNRKHGGLIVHLNFNMMTLHDLKKKEWRKLGWMRRNSWSIRDPVVMEREGRKITDEELLNCIHFVKNWENLTEIIEQYKRIGAEAVILTSSANKEKIRSLANNILSVF